MICSMASCFQIIFYLILQEWVTSLGQQVRAARQSCVLPSKLPSLQPLPPPHVRPTLTPPYIHLTEWIRALLAQNQLSLEQIRSLRKPCRIISQSVSANPRKHKVEMVIYPQLKLQQPSLEALDKKIMQEFRKKQHPDNGPEMLVSLKDPSRPESNPFGFIRYMDKPDEPIASSLSKSKYVEDKREEIVSYDNEDMTFLLPKSLLESCTTSVLSRQDTVESQEASSPTPDAPWGRRLPPLHGSDPAPPPMRVTSELASTGEPRCRVARPVAHASSAPVLSEKPDRPRRHKSPNPKREESPPDWLSCFPKSPKPRRKAFSATKAEAAARIPEDAYKKAPTRPPTMKYIDKTPSADSLNLPYCPPVKVDYENFSNSSLFNMQQQQASNPGFMSPQLPRRNKTVRPHSKIRSRSLGRTSQLAVIPVEDPSELPRLHCTELVAEVASYPRRGQEEARGAPHCTCDSRRSSDSGLADIASHSEQCPLWRSLQSVTSLPGMRAPPTPSTRQCSCGASLPPAQHSLSLEQLPTTTPALTPDPALSCGNLSSEIQAPARWNRTKETYKTGLYAHWWLNASLQPISEEPHLSTQL